MTKDQIWEELSPFFTMRDSALPDIGIGPLTEDGAQKIFSFLLENSAPLTEDDVADVHLTLAVPLNSLENPVSMLYARKLNSIFVSLKDIKYQEKPIPNLGCLLLPGVIELSYKLGFHWNPDNLFLFVSLLLELRTFEPSARIYIAEGEAPFVNEEKVIFAEFMGQLASEFKKPAF